MNANYTTEQQAAIDEAVAQAVSSRGMEYNHAGELAHHGITGEPFAVFGTTAYKLMTGAHHDTEVDTIVEFLPVIMNGNLVGQFPDEGRSGVLHLVRISRRRGVDRPDAKWHASFNSAGWIYSHELSASNEEILSNIADEAHTAF